MASDVAYGNFDDAFVDTLAARCAGKVVLEVFAGNGLLASKLTARGVRIVATSLFASHDGHEQGMNHPVIERHAVDAVRELGREADLLLMSWPTTTEAAAFAAIEWGRERPVLYVGEVTDFTLGMMGLGGCASDSFFKMMAVEEEMAGYAPRTRLDRALVMRLAHDRGEALRILAANRWAPFCWTPRRSAFRTSAQGRTATEEAMLTFADLLDFAGLTRDDVDVMIVERRMHALAVVGRAASLEHVAVGAVPSVAASLVGASPCRSARPRARRRRETGV